MYGNEHAALDALSCEAHENPLKPPTLMSSDKSDVEDVKEFIAKDARRKREEEQMQGDDYRTNYLDPNGILPQPPQATTQRGDIPSMDIESCDGMYSFIFFIYLISFMTWLIYLVSISLLSVFLPKSNLSVFVMLFPSIRFHSQDESNICHCGPQYFLNYDNFFAILLSPH